MPKIARSKWSCEFRSMHETGKAKGENNDCTVVAIAIACNVSYDVAHEAMRKAGRISRRGAYQHQQIAAINSLGFKVRFWSFMDIREMIQRYPGNHKNLQSITSHHPRRFAAAWAGCHPNLLMHSNGHVLAVKDGVVNDWAVNKSLRIISVWEVEKI